MAFETALALPHPRLSEGRFASVACYTDEGLFAATGVRIAFLERHGGASVGPYASLNTSPFLDDDGAAVARNHTIVLEAFDAAHCALVQPMQVHGNAVVAVQSAAEAPQAAERARQGADALVVTCDDVAGILSFADCVPLIAVAPGGAFAVIHAGWRGVKNLVWARAIDQLCATAAAAPADLNVYIGPYIHRCHFEVSEELVCAFEEQFGPACRTDNRHVDLGAALRRGLIDLGISLDRIADADVCTVCDGGERFYSYRATEGACGRHGAFAVKASARR